MRLTKLAIPAQQKRISAQQATGIQQAPGGGFRLAGEETVLIPAPGAYPTSLSAESSECLHQGLRVVYVLAQYMPKYLEVSSYTCRCRFTVKGVFSSILHAFSGA